MRHAIVTYVSVRDLAGDPVLSLPSIPGAAIAWSEHLDGEPRLYIAAPEDADLHIDGVVRILSQQEFEDARTAHDHALTTEMRERLRQTLARRRYRAETAGVNVSLSQGRTEPVTVHLDTARDARPSLLGAAFGAQLDPTAQASWKDAKGQFVEASSAEILQMAAAVLRHVQACYAHEASIRSALDAAKDREALLTVAKQIETGWPA